MIFIYLFILVEQMIMRSCGSGGGGNGSDAGGSGNGSSGGGNGCGDDLVKIVEDGFAAIVRDGSKKEKKTLSSNYI